MFGFLKNLRRKPAAPTTQTPTKVQAQPQSSGSSGNAPPVWNYGPARKSGAQQSGTGRGIEVPLKSILELLPLELQPRVAQSDVRGLNISVPLEKVLAQLSRGAIKISFGELRQSAPGVFSPEPDRDRVMVDLPLNEVLSRLNPALIQRRRVQRQIEVPPEISSPFDLQNGGLIFSAGPAAAKPGHEKPRHTSPGSAASGTTMANRQGFGPLTPPLPAQASEPHTMVPKPPPPPALPKAPSQRAFPPTLPGSSHTGFSTSQGASPQRPIAAPSGFGTGFLPKAAPAGPPPGTHFVPKTVPGPGSSTSLTPRPQTPGTGLTPRPVAHAPVPRPTPPADVPPAKPAPAPAAPSAPAIVVGLTTVAETWPEAIRKEILDLQLIEARLALPPDAVEQALKQGRVVFSWKTLRSWITPVQTPTASPHDGVVLELPLKVIAPLFLTRQKEIASAQKKITVDEEIPNLFFGFPQPDGAASGSPPKPTDSNYYVWDDKSDTVRVHESEVRRGTSPGTKLGAKFATPNEVVARASSLDGVAGALIALPDGLMVAGRLPPEYNGETIAAFLPQIFGKVSASTRELRMGELNNLHFTVGNVPWKMFRVNAIFFAAFGRAGESLPTSQLAALAAELDHKPK